MLTSRALIKKLGLTKIANLGEDDLPYDDIALDWRRMECPYPPCLIPISSSSLDEEYYGICIKFRDGQLEYSYCEYYGQTNTNYLIEIARTEDQFLFYQLLNVVNNEREDLLEKMSSRKTIHGSKTPTITV